LHPGPGRILNLCDEAAKVFLEIPYNQLINRNGDGMTTVDAAGHHTAIKFSHPSLLLLVAASVLAAIPVWVAAYPPMADLSQHAAQVSMFRNLHNPSFPFADSLLVNWFTPYLLGYALIYALAPLFGILVSTKLVVSLALVSTPLLTAIVIRELGGDPLWAVLTIPGMYGFSFEWGFLNYLVAAPLGIAFFWISIRHVRKPTFTTWAGLALAGLGLFFSHALVWGFFVGACVIYILCESPNFKRGLLLALAALITAPLILLWMLRSQSNGTEFYTQTIWDLGWIDSSEWGPLWGRAAGFMARLLGFKPGIGCTVVGLLLFALPLIAGCRPNRRWSAWSPFAGCLLILFLAPTTLLVTAGSGASMVYQRFAMFALPLFLCALSAPDPAGDGSSQPEPRKRSKRYGILRMVTPILMLIWVGVICSRVAHFSKEARGFGEMLARMKPNQRALSMVFYPYSDVSIAEVFLHFPQWYAAEKDGIVDPNFSTSGNVLVLYREGRAPLVPPHFDLRPDLFNWTADDGASYRYFIVRGKEDYGRFLFRDATCDISLSSHQNGWWLYERADHCGQEHEGLRLSYLQDDSPVGKAGFKSGDVMIEFDGQEIDNQTDLLNLLGAHHAGDKVMVNAMRGQEKITKEVTLGSSR
jgi:hypothetical protein